jgi:hypothetical protein
VNLPAHAKVTLVNWDSNKADIGRPPTYIALGDRSKSSPPRCNKNAGADASGVPFVTSTAAHLCLNGLCVSIAVL